MEYIQYEQDGGVGIVTINRPKALNALNTQVLGELDTCFAAIDVDTVRCVILTGAGEKAFVAGADISEMRTMTQAEAKAYGQMGNGVFRTIETFPLPVIAAVNGFALGGGCELSMACDIRLASENAVFGQPEVALGIIPGFGGTQRLARIVGPGKAKELLYTVARIKAAVALEIGLVNGVYPQDQLMDEARKMAGKIAANAPIAVRRTKKAVNDGWPLDMDSALAMESGLFGGCFETQDQTNAMGAFVEKRTPEAFQNR